MNVLSLRKVGSVGAAAFAATFILGGTAQGADVDLGTFALSNGNQSASATFTFDNVANTLTIQLTNTMTENKGPQWLTGLFFNLDGADITGYNSLGGMTEMITLSDTTRTAYNAHTADQFWGFRDDLSPGDLPFGDQQYGLAAAGFGVFGSGDMLAPGGPMPQPDGTDGGILADIAGLEVPNGHEGKPFVLGSLWLVFDLGNFTGDLSVSDVNFAFGTGFDEVVLVPMPLALPLGLAGLAAVAIGRKRLGRRMAS